MKAISAAREVLSIVSASEKVTLVREGDLEEHVDIGMYELCSNATLNHMLTSITSDVSSLCFSEFQAQKLIKYFNSSILGGRKWFDSSSDLAILLPYKDGEGNRFIQFLHPSLFGEQLSYDSLDVPSTDNNVMRVQQSCRVRLAVLRSAD